MTSKKIEVFFSDIRLTNEMCRTLYTGLSHAEREKADRFLREDDRLRFITGRRMIRTFAAERLGMSAPKILLTEYGKPYIGGAKDFHFSISHSGHLVVIAVSDSPVGIDIEQHIPVEWRELSDTFTPVEREMLGRAADPVSCFYRIWTIREAFAKEEGIGLPLFDEADPDIDYSGGTVRYNEKTLHFTAWEKEDYSVCVCGKNAVPDTVVVSAEPMII